MRRQEMTADVLVTNEPTAPAKEQSQAVLVATIRAAKGGDTRAFEDLMIASERRVATLAWRILGDTEEVKEALQETFLRVFRHLGRFDESRDYFGWLFRIAVNVCRDLDARRKRRRLFFAPIDDAVTLARESTADQDIASRDDLAILERAIDALPMKERLAIVLRDIEELSTDEVAAILGSRPATIRVQISKARVKLRQWIDAVRRGERR